MKSFYEKEDYTIEDIQALITDQVEESIYLDFKGAGALGKSDGKKTEISKDVASFANSDGGIIVYGLKEENHVASELSFVDGNEFTKEWLEQVVNSSIQRNISGLKIYPIRNNGNLNETIYIMKIPASLEAPHISKDNRYYKRYNFMSVFMEEYEVRESYNRKAKTNLLINEIIIKNQGGGSQGDSLRNARYSLTFQIENISASIENQYKMEVSIPKGYLSGINQMTRYFVRDEGEFSIFSIPNQSPIYQNEITSVITTEIDITSYTMILLSLPITVKLYYSSGIKAKEFLLEESLPFRGKLLKDWTWL